MEGLSLSMSSIIAMIVFSVSGLYVFRNGRKQQNVNLIVIGVVLMFYSYFTTAPWQDWVFGLLLMGGAYFLRD